MPQSPSFQWQWNGKIAIFVLIFLPLTIGLGIWQLQRAEEKRDILAEQAERRDQPALTSPAALADTEGLHLRRFELDVVFDQRRWFLLENRMYSGRPGYEVLSLARPIDGQGLLLVNRGWVPASLDRSELPDIQTPIGQVRISGYIYRQQESFFRLGEQSWSGRWPERLQHPDVELIRERLEDGDRLVPARFRLDADNPHAYAIDWEVVNQSPARHIGYAVQWFALALALFILAVFANSNLAALVTNRHRD